MFPVPVLLCAIYYLDKVGLKVGSEVWRRGSPARCLVEWIYVGLWRIGHEPIMRVYQWLIAVAIGLVMWIYWSFPLL